MRTIKERLQSDDQIVRVFSVGRVPHPVIVEMFALAGGFHGFWIDQEHASPSVEQIMVAALAGRANGLDCFVRIPPTGYWQVTQCLEAGAGGVMAAQIQDVAQAQQFVRWCKFAPQGVRGLNTGGRDADYTHVPIEQFIETSNRDRLVGIQIETLGALQSAGDIAALEGVDLLFLGPVDLSLALGIPGQFHHERFWEAVEQIAVGSKRHNKAWGCVAPDAAFAQRAIELGCRLPTLGNDVTALRCGIQAMQQTFQAQFETGDDPR